MNGVDVIPAVSYRKMGLKKMGPKTFGPMVSNFEVFLVIEF
jgi:hypothetical protein